MVITQENFDIEVTVNKRNNFWLYSELIIIVHFVSQENEKKIELRTN